MIERIIDFSVRNKFLVLLLVGAAALAGARALRNVPLDAIPDLGDTQVIVYSRWDRSPDLIEAQVTYPIVTAMLGAPRVRAVRGVSDFGYSFVYVIFEDGTDTYWARTRTLEYLSGVLSRLPPDSRTELGPDATGLGWVFQYALVDRSGRHSLADLRSYQDWYLRYHLKAVPGVSEVASLGGFGKQYQVNVDPNRLRNYGLSIQRVVEAVRGGNAETAGRLIEFGGTEYMVRGRGYAKSIADFESIVVSASESGTPIRIRDIGHVTVGPDLRRGVADLDGAGEVVSGIVVMRQGENAVDVIDRVKERIRQIEPGLPSGMEIVPIYDRSALIRRAIDNVSETLVEVVLTVVFIVLLFLWHVPSALIPLITIPVAVLVAFIPFRAMGITANIMSLGGIAIAMGELVDAAIVVVEQTHKKLEQAQRDGSTRDYHEVVLEAVKEVAPASFFALLVIAVSFLPVLTLEAQEGRMFKPLAYTKTLTMLVAAGLVITLDPALRVLFTRVRRFEFRPAWLCRATNAVLVGRIRSEESHPISRFLTRMYEPVVRWSLRWKWSVIGGAAALIVVTVPVFTHLGSEFMPPLRRGVAFLHADDDARHLDRRGAEAGAGERPDDQAVPRGRSRARQGGARRHEHRSRAALDARDGDHAQADVRVAPGRDVVLRVGAGMDEARAPARHARSHLRGAAGRGDERGADVSRGFERLDDADQGADRHADDRHPHAGRAEDLRRRFRRDREDRHGDRGGAPLRERHAQRVRGAHRQRVLPRHRVEPRRARALRLERRGGAERGAERDRRRERDHHDRGARAVSGERPLHARFPIRHRRARARARAGVGWAAADPARRAGAREGRDRTRDDPQRGRAAHRIRLRGRRRPRHQQLRGRGEPRRARAGEAAARLRGALERPVRSDGPRARASRVHHPVHAAPRVACFCT